MGEKKRLLPLHTKFPELVFMSLLSDQVLLKWRPYQSQLLCGTGCSGYFNYFSSLRLEELELISQVFSPHEQAKMLSEDFPQKLYFSSVSFLLS